MSERIGGRLLDDSVDADGQMITREALREAVRKFALPAKVRWEFQPASIGRIKSLEVVEGDEGTHLRATIELDEKEER